MNNLPNLSDFKVFCVVAKRRSFVESAEELGSSPAYVSKRINILETNLGGVSKSMLKKSRLNFDKIEKCK